MRLSAAAGRGLKALAVVTLLSLTTACADGGPLGVTTAAPRLTTVYDRLLPGAVMPVDVVNPAIRTWEFGGCPPSLERLDDGVWVNAGPEYLVCAAMLNVLHPGESQRWSVTLPEQHGIYRVVFTFHHENSDYRSPGTRVYSNQFRVDGENADL